MTVNDIQEMDPLGKKIKSLRNTYVTTPFDNAHEAVQQWKLTPMPPATKSEDLPLLSTVPDWFTL